MDTVNDIPLLSLRGITKRFRSPLSNVFRERAEIEALSSVNLDIPEGKVTCLLGPNGAGKTTLIKILASLITADSGEILFRGDSFFCGGKTAIDTIALVTPNERSFYWRLTGRENLAFFARLHGLKGKDLADRVANALRESGMTESADKPYRLYSAGTKQKLNIARALLGSPSLFLLDEPATHLDPLAREEFWDFIERALIGSRGATVFLCTHDLQEARRLADRVVVLDSGRVVATGSPGELGERIGDRREIEMRFAGIPPRAWVDGWGDSLRFAGNDRLRLLIDETRMSQEAAIRGFLESGGRLLEVFPVDDDLLTLLRRKVGSR